MSSGQKTVVFNTLERLVSTDHNRLQKFQARALAETFRYLMDVSSGSDDVDAGAIQTEFSTQESPLRAEVVNGLLVRPQVGSLNVLVDAGLLFCVDPDTSPSADDSPYKHVRTPGVPTLGALAMTANPSGSIRIDVVECRRTGASDQVVETDNRDLFNPTTGLFTATTVTKAVESQLEFRVRAGTPGSGFPGTASGWLPLAVASVAAGATSCDQATFWDVRRMVQDRTRAPYNLSLTTPRTRRSQINASVLTAVGGLVEADLGTRRVGGQLRTGSVATDAATVNLTVAANRDPGFTLVANRPWYLYLAQPLGLPRWARYTDSTSGSRVPRSPRGIPIASTVAPDADGKPTAVVGLPAAMGFAGATAAVTEAVCVGAGFADSGAAMGGFYGDEQGYILCSGTSIATNPISASGSVADPTNVTFTPNTHYPACARALLLDVTWPLSASGPAVDGGDFVLYVHQPGATASGSNQLVEIRVPWRTAHFNPVGPSAFLMQFSMWVTLPTVYPSASVPTRQDFSLLFNGGFSVGGASAWRIMGWRL